MGNCLKQLAQSDKQSQQISPNKNNNNKLSHPINHSNENLYKEQQEQTEQISEIAQPEFLCPSKNKIVYICLQEVCQKNCLHCEKHSCPACYKVHNVIPRSIPLKWLTDELNKRASAETKFMKKIDEIQATMINRLKLKKKSILEKINLVGMDQIDQRLIRSLYIKKDVSTDLSGRYLNACFEKLSKFNKQMSSYSKSFEIQFEESMESLFRRIQDQKQAIIQRFSNNMMGNYSLSKRQKQINDFPNPKWPNKKFFKINADNEVLKIQHLTRNQQFHYFVFDEAIRQKRVTTFRINHSHTFNHNIFTGIATPNLFGKVGAIQTLRNKESILYSSSDGKIYENEKQNTAFMQKGRVVKDGEILELQVNLIEWTLSWRIGPQQLATTKINQFMQHKVLYLVVMMLWDDQVQILLQ